MIRVLPANVVNQIAAGEVIERPFSVVKELVENSLDAGAQRVHVELADGGRELIRVHDDGGGIAEADLALAFVGHATSKLTDAADLDHIASLGFRGEALASIGSVAQARIVSRQGGEQGHEVRCDGGALGEVKPSGCPPGTTVEVRDLFFNTPARRRFLKTPAAEKARIQEMIQRLALAHPQVDFTLSVDGKDVLRLPGGEELPARIGRAFGRNVADGLIEIAGAPTHARGYRVGGWIGDPDIARRDSKLELLFVNGRHVRDKSAGHAIRQAYRAHLMPQRFPVYFLSLDMPPAEVDVNVHPTKAEVRFRDSRAVYGILYEAVRATLGGQQPRAQAASLEAGADLPKARTGFPDLPADLFGRPPAGASSGAPAGASSVREEPAARAAAAPGGATAREPATPPSTPGDARPHPFRDLAVADRPFLQVMNLYIVLEVPDGMMVVDQHALHERVMYERLLAAHDPDRGVPVQRLLVPEVLELTPVDKTYLLEAADALAETGFLIDDFGGTSVAVQGVPAVLGRARPGKLVESFLLGDDPGEPRPRAREAILERFHSRACRSSVMSGDVLSQEEIAALLEAAQGLDHPHNCPHGRPTVLTFGEAELEKYFRRRV